MSLRPSLNPAGVFVEFTTHAMALLRAATVREWPLERTASGALTESCVARIKAEVPAALDRKPWQPRLEAWCALPAGGVSLRRWKFPRSTGDELQRVIRLQIESEFPLAPEELAWGWQRLNETGGTQAVLVAAVKKDLVAEYTEVLGACELNPSFTIAALARGALAPDASREGGLLHIGREHSEWLSADGSGPRRLRVLRWGEQTVVRQLVAQTGMTREAAESLIAKLADAPPEAAGAEVERAMDAAVDSLGTWLTANPPGPRVRVTGRLAAAPSFTAALSRRLGSGVVCDSLEPSTASGVSATLRGLQVQAHDSSGRLVLRTQPAEGAAVLAQPTPRRWAAVAGVLLLGLLALPYAEALLLQPRLAARVAAVKAQQDRLTLIDRESGFLRHLRQNQAPYLETLYVLGQTAPPGTRIDSFQLNRKGELSLRLSLRQPQQVTEFRSKLADSGFFSSVVVEEQTPTPDQQKVLARLSAQVKPSSARQGLKILALEPPPPAPTGGPPARPGVGPRPPSGIALPASP